MSCDGHLGNSALRKLLHNAIYTDLCTCYTFGNVCTVWTHRLSVKLTLGCEVTISSLEPLKSLAAQIPV